MKLSVVIITKNEEKNIARCLTSVMFADEVIMVDAESTDKTREIAESMGAKVFLRAWNGYGDQKNFGRLQAQGQWLLFIDADEEVPSELADEIITTIHSAKHDFYWVKIVTVFLSKPLYHLYGHNPRLFKKESGRWNDANVHEQVEHVVEDIRITLGDHHSDVLQNPLLHHSHSSIKSYLKKMHVYTSLDAKQMFTTNMHRSGRAVSPSFFLAPHHNLRQLGKLLFYRKGILDGFPGMLWCALSAYYEYEMAQKYKTLVNESL